MTPTVLKCYGVKHINNILTLIIETAAITDEDYPILPLFFKLSFPVKQLITRQSDHV